MSTTSRFFPHKYTILVLRTLRDFSKCSDPGIATKPRKPMASVEILVSAGAHHWGLRCGFRVWV